MTTMAKATVSAQTPCLSRTASSLHAPPSLPMLRLFFLLVCLALWLLPLPSAHAQASWAPASSAPAAASTPSLPIGQTDSPAFSLPGLAPALPALLPEAQAFALSVALGPDNQIELRYRIAPGYYLYREKLDWHWQNGAQPSSATPRLPGGEFIFDPTFQRDMEVYRDALTFRLPIPQLPGRPVLTLNADSQGCAEGRLCYPPLQHQITLTDNGQAGYDVTLVHIADEALSNPEISATGTATVQPGLANMRSTGSSRLDTAATPPLSDNSASLAASNDATRVGTATTVHETAPGTATSSTLTGNDLGLANYLASAGSSFWAQLATFFSLGLLLSLTPCVLPMVPIVSAMLLSAPAGTLSRRRSLLLAGAYVGGMSLVYTAMGLLAGASGAALSSWLQMPWMIGLFACALALLALAQFDVFTLQMPSALQSRLGSIGQGGIANSMPRAMLLGGVSALVIGPCVAAPLAGALLYLSQSGDVTRAGLSLFIMAWGMGVPLLLLGVLAGRWRPRPGPWMERIRHLTGLLLLATAWWLGSPMLSDAAGLLGWAALACFAAVLCGAFEPLPQPIRPGPALVKTMSLLLASLGLVWLLSAASGGRDPLAPLVHWRTPEVSQAAPLQFTTVASTAELDAALAASTQPVMLDVYADWCTVCHQMERNTLSNPAVTERLQAYTLLRLDVTRASSADRALMKRLQIFGPPALLFYDAGGKAREDARVIGYLDASQFLAVLDRVSVGQ